jgi:hypothetical protein
LASFSRNAGVASAACEHSVPALAARQARREAWRGSLASESRKFTTSRATRAPHRQGLEHVDKLAVAR